MSDWHQGLSSRVISEVSYRVFRTLINTSQAHPGSLWTGTFSSCGSEKSWFVLCKDLWKQHWGVSITQVIAYFLNTQKHYIKIQRSFVFICFIFCFCAELPWWQVKFTAVKGMDMNISLKFTYSRFPMSQVKTLPASLQKEAIRPRYVPSSYWKVRPLFQRSLRGI